MTLVAYRAKEDLYYLFLQTIFNRKFLLERAKVILKLLVALRQKNLDKKEVAD